MPLYNYHGLHRPSGRKTRGVIDAVTKIAAARALDQRDITVISLAEQGRLPDFLPFGGNLSSRWLIDFFRQLSLYTGAHLPLPDALALLAKGGKGNERQRAVAERLAEAVAGGSSLTAALRETGLFPAAAVALVEAGEISGTLERLLPAAADMLERSYRARQRLFAMLIYPALLLTALGAALTLLLFFVLPAFEALFAQLGVRLPLITRLVLTVGGFLLDFGWLLLALLILTAAGIFFARKNPAYRRELDRLLLRLPLLGELLCLTDSADTAAALSALLGGGLPLADSLEIAAGVPANAYLLWQLERAAGATRAGRKLAAALGGSQGFSPIFLNLMAAGEETGSLPESLRRAAEICRFEGKSRRKKLEALLEPTLLLLVGALAALIVFALALPLLDTLTVL